MNVSIDIIETGEEIIVYIKVKTEKNVESSATTSSEDKDAMPNVGEDLLTDYEIKLDIKEMELKSKEISLKNIEDTLKKTKEALKCKEKVLALKEEKLRRQHQREGNETAKKRKRPKHFTCLNCQETFMSWKDLRRHKYGSCEGSGGPPFQCKSCSRTFASTNSLRLHLKRACPLMEPQNAAVMEYDDVGVDNEDGDGDDVEYNHEDDKLLVTGQGDLEDTKDEKY